MNKGLDSNVNALRAALRYGFFAVVATALLAGCTTFGGGNLVPGKSTSADVVGIVGAPKAKVALAGGVTRWFYPRGPIGQETYAVNVGADGIVQSVEQTLTPENVEKVRAGTMTSKDVLALLGPPNKITRFAGRARDAWEYRMYDVDWKVLTLELSDDGVVRSVQYEVDPTFNVPSGGECQRC